MTHSRGFAYHPAILESRGDEMSGVSMNNGSVVPSIILVSQIQGFLENCVRERVVGVMTGENDVGAELARRPSRS
jgi:hypothetical protein